jgi:hypothetical protein
VSADGTTWVTVATLFTPFPYAVHAGFAATGDAEFAKVAVDTLGAHALLLSVERDADTTTVRWNKPDDALTFTLSRSTGGGQWEVLKKDTREYAHEDKNLRHGTRAYKVTAALVDGGTRDSAVTVAVAETLAQVLTRARRTDASEWTKKSYAAFTAELDRIEKATGDPETARVDAVYAAHELLISVDTLLRKFQVTPSMVVASTTQWPGTGTKEAAGWRAFDGDPTTYTDTTAAESWIDIDAGASGPITVDRIRLYPRGDQLSRANGTVFRGSDEAGAGWTDFHTVSGVDTARWYEFRLAERVSYQRIRVYDGRNGRCNVGEIEFWYQLPDEE